MSKFKMPSAYTILIGIIIVVALLTWIVPAGQYDKVFKFPQNHATKSK